MKQTLSEARSVGSATLKGNKRTPGKEQFYTPFDLSERLVRVVKGLVQDYDPRLLIEPAAGTGSFVEAFKKVGNNKFLAFDIEPKHPEVLRMNFLEEELPKGIKGAIAITNPPFGRNHSLSVPCFNRLAPVCDYICFVIPKSWRKWSVQNRLDNNFHLIYDEELSIDYLDDKGNLLPSGKGSLKTVFQVWKKEDYKRSKVQVEDRHLISKVEPQEADVSLTVFGRGCGKVKDVSPRRPNTTQMFLKLHHPAVRKALGEVDFSRFCNNVAFVEALSWNEINYLLNEWFDKN